MLEMLFLSLASILILCTGIYMCAKPLAVAKKIKNFCTAYPLIRYAGAKQLSSRPHFIILIGIVFIVVGILCILSLQGENFNSIR